MAESVGPLQVAAKAVFYVTAGVTLVGAWAAVSARNLFRAALGLAVALFGVAVLYLFLQAEFLAVTQLLIYVGAILTLLIFGVMLTARMADPTLPRWNRQAWLVGLLTAGVGLGLGCLYLKTPWPPLAERPPVAVADLGRAILSTQLLPFELLSLLLLGALVGAIVVARKGEGDKA